MPSVLYDAISLMDPYVKLKSGGVVRTVEQILFSLDLNDPTEYVLGLDESRRFIISLVDNHGYLVSPPIFVEERLSAANPISNRYPSPGVEKFDHRWYA